MPRVVLARHGRAIGEDRGEILGRSDPDLTDLGLAQAAALADRVAELHISALITSPLRRARRTADVIGRQLGIEPALAEDLTDLDAGRLTGAAPDDLLIAHPDLYETWIDHPERFAFPDGESLTGLRERVTGAIDRILDEYPEEANLLIVTHEHPARTLLTLLLGLGPEAHFQIDLDPGAISVFERRAGHFYLTLLNETCHLAGAGPHLIVADR